MPPRTNRLTKSEIEEVIKTGRFLNTPTLAALGASCKFLPKESSFKIAIAVSKKTAPHAVDRNKLRRKWYNALYRTYKKGSALQKGTSPSGWYLLQLRPGALTYLNTIPNEIHLPHILLRASL